ncbi:MAG: RNA-directed DNA polymerase [Paraglaciecola sp.]|jgi:RNA-directed DNA polymerase
MQNPYLKKLSKHLELYELLEAYFAKDHKPNKAELHSFLSSMNSYLGMMKHYRTQNLRKKMLFKHLSVWWWNQICLIGGIAKFVKKRRPV